MYAVDRHASDGGADRLLTEQRLMGLEPERPRRPEGDIHESPMLGRLAFFPMPSGRPSFWRGQQRMPDSRYPLEVVCEVEGDDLPGSDQAACVTAFRRLQVQDAMLSAPLINRRLSELKSPLQAIKITADDLMLTSIHLTAHPLIDARYELGFRAAPLPRLVFTVVFARGAPSSVRVDSDG